MVYYLIRILYLFYTIEMMLDQKLVQAMSYFISKCVVKRQRQVSSMKTSFVSGTANENTVHHEARKSENEMRARKMRGTVTTVTSRQ